MKKIRTRLGLRTVVLGLTFAAVLLAVRFHTTDGSIDGSLAVGLDTPTTPSFGFTTLLMMENNLRLKFDDTSNSASFPGNDWSLEANESSNGGRNAFFLRDCGLSSQGNCSGNAVFTVEAGARNNALYVEDDGDIGIGTSIPAVDLQIQTGNTPTLRLAQDGTSGFTPQSWDVAGNEASFFIRDVTNGSALPFRIRPGAVTNAIDIKANGKIGIGTDTPKIDNKGIHVKSANDTTAASVGIGVDATGATGNCAMNLQYGPPQGHTFITARPCSNNEQIRMFVGSTERMTLTTTGVNIAGNLSISGGNCSDAPGGGGCTPDYVFKPGYELESIDEHAESMWANSHLPAVGKGSKDGSFEITKTTWGMLEELEKAHIYIDQLNDQLRQKTGEIEQLNDRLVRLEAAVLNGNQASADH